MKDHAAIVLRDGNNVLFVQRAATKKSLPNIWAFPSGTIEEGEIAEITAVREAKEELHIDVEVEKSLGMIELPEFEARLYLIVCKQKYNQPLMCDPAEIQAIRWLTFDEFFDVYTDSQIGHGLIYLRKNPLILSPYF